MILAPVFTWYWIDTKIPQYGSILLAEHWGDAGSCKRSTWLARHAVVVVTYVTGGVGGGGGVGRQAAVRPPGSARDAVIAILWEEDGEEKKGFNPSRRSVCACMCTYAQVCREGGRRE